MGILTRIEQRSLKNPQKWLKDFFTNGFTSATKANVTNDKALGITAFWNGVRIISQTRASLPMQVFELTDDGREMRRNHAVHRLLNIRPNPFMTPYTFKEIRSAHELTWGNSYAEIQRDGAGRPVALWPLLPDRTGVEIRDNQKWYWTLVDGKKIFLAPDRVLHVPGLGFDGLRGYNVIKMHREALGLSIAANEYGARFFGNSARPHGVLVHSGKPGPEERQEIKEQWNQAHSGLTDAQRTAVLWGGMEFKKISMSPEESQFLQTRTIQVDEVARILNINPILLQQTQGATVFGTAIGQFLVAYAKFTITPWVEREEDVINHDLFPERQRGRLFVKGNVNAIMRGDPKQQAEVLEIKRRNGVISANEWRALDEQNPIDGDEGEVFTTPLNWQNMANLSDNSEPAGGGGFDQNGRRSLPAPENRQSGARKRTRKAHKQVVEDGARRFVRREVEAMRRAIKRAFNSDAPAESLNDWIEEFYPKHRESVIQTMQPIIASVSETIAMQAAEEVNAEDPGDIDGFVAGFTAGLATREINSSIGQIRGILDEQALENVQEALNQRATEWMETRAGKVADRETVRAATGVTRHVWQQAGVSKMVWDAGGDFCPLCREMDGRTASVTSKFLASGDAVNPGGDTTPLVTTTDIVAPPLHEGCDCDIRPG